MRNDHFDKVIDSLTGLYEQHYTSWRLQVLAQVLNTVVTFNFCALGLILKKMINLADSSIEDTDLEAVVVHVQNQVLAYIRQS